MTSHELVVFLQVLVLSGTCLAVYNLLRTGLFRRYAFFFWYLVFRIPDSLWPIFLGPKSKAYFWCFVVTTPIGWVFSFLIVREIYGLLLEKYQGMATLGRWIMYLGIALSVTLSVLSFLPKLPKGATQSSAHLGYIYAVERGVTFGLAIFLLIVLFLLTRFAVVASRNVALHTLLFAAYYLSRSMVTIMRDVFGFQLFPQFNTIQAIVVAICMFAWFFVLKPRGEEVKLNLPYIDPAQEERILYQLAAINSTLTKVGSK